MPARGLGEGVSISKEWDGDGHVQNLFVKKCNHVVVLTHEPTGNVNSIQPLPAVVTQKLTGLGRQVGSGCEIEITQRHDAAHNLLPLHSLYISIRNVKKMVVEIVHRL